MKNKFEYKNKILIINPTQLDFRELKLNFLKEDVNTLYLAQIRELSDDNSYDTFIFYEKNGKTFYWHEFENPQHASYFNNEKELDIHQYFQILNHYDKLMGDTFFKKAIINHNYQELEKEISNKKENKIVKIKKNKI